MIFDIVETEDKIFFVEQRMYDAWYVVDSYSVEFSIENRGPYIACCDGYENAVCWEK